MYQFGATLSVDCGAYRHVGLSLGNGAVLHNQRGQGERIVSISEFSGGRPVTAKHNPMGDVVSVVKRIEKAVRNKKTHNLFFAKCEHTESELRSGTASSPQIERLFIGIMIVAGLFYFGLKSK